MTKFSAGSTDCFCEGIVYNGHCFEMGRNKSELTTTEHICLDKGGHLAIFADNATHDAIVPYVEAVFPVA